ncbi:hypothetical protein QQF64_017438 [Cirrhinus molitorella]|uniref:Uncharacterized protein n=1 Tax=Cirrhinus molitorella TaxID=172907 RepID=A0ABR3LK83_9TELE
MLTDMLSQLAFGFNRRLHEEGPQLAVVSPRGTCYWLVAVKESWIYVAVTAGSQTNHGRASVSRQNVCFTFVPPLPLSPLLLKLLPHKLTSRDLLG